MKLSDLQKERIRHLRAQGATFSEIRNDLGLVLANSSLSYICKDVEMPEGHMQRIKELNARHLQIARGKAVVRNKEIYATMLAGIETANINIFEEGNISTLKAALAMLYLGEGSKWRSYRGLSLGSSSPEIIGIYIGLLERCYAIQIESLRARVQCRADQDPCVLEAYWSIVTGIPKEHFYKTYVDRRTAGKPTKRSDYRGVCVIMCSGTHVQQELAIIAKLLFKHLGH
ncbi:MAG TPA: hypothetical protein VLE73_02345 [Candidatus Saccharimonadales bacterium]|nr:hypothetical protein [Candidatus Saccharimonadales bacterium]